MNIDKSQISNYCYPHVITKLTAVIMFCGMLWMH